MSNVETATGQKSWLVAPLLCLFLGMVGGHRFSTGSSTDRPPTR